MSTGSLLASLFVPVEFRPELMAWLFALQPDLSQSWFHHPWDSHWSGGDRFYYFTVWTPPPKMAEQTISFILQAWVEMPTVTSVVLFIPRILTHDWAGLSKHLQDLGFFLSAKCLSYSAHLLPVSILYLAPHQHILPPPDDRLDWPPLSTNARWHRKCTESLHGLSATHTPP